MFIRLASSLILISFIFISGELIAQSNQTIKPENVHIASPNASSLGKVADIPIGYHTGIPNIDLPIYTAHQGSLQVPISLSYHAAGLRVMEQASWVGAGWSLNAGGMITRTVRGAPDEQLSSVTPTPISYLSSNGYYPYLYECAGAFTPHALPTSSSEMNLTCGVGFELGLDYRNFASSAKDGEADLFTFNFNGYSGKFYFRPDNSVVLAPQQDIRVQPLTCDTGDPNCNPSNEYLHGWIVTTPDGVRYYFGKDLSVGNYNTTTNAVPVEYTTTYSSTSGISYSKTASSWFLNKIQSSDGKDVINFTYTKESYSSYSISSFPLPGYLSGSLPGEGIDLVKNFIIGVRLNTISFLNGSVNFIPSTTARQDLSSSAGGLNDTDPIDPANINNAMSLAEIRIYKGAVPFKTFAFNYEYFYDSTNPLKGYLANQGNQYNIHSDKKRLKLISFNEKSYDGSISNPPHVFTYFDEASVPRTLSFAQDHWGYFNGATSNTSLMPAVSLNGGVTNAGSYNANRESSWPAMRAGTLQKIQYPTSGHSRFVFSNHNVYIPITKYDSTNIGYKNAAFTATSTVTNFTITASTTFKTRVNYPYYANYSSGYVHIVNTATSVDYGVTTGGGGQGLHIFQLPAGTYQYSVQCTSNTYYPIECTLWKITPTYTQLVNTPVGGLRIDSLIYNAGDIANERIEMFSYVDGNGTAQGVLYSRPTYVALLRNDRTMLSGGSEVSTHLDFFTNINGCVNNNPSSEQPQYGFFASAAPIFPMRTSQGNHLGYNQVRVTQKDGGYTIYKFTLGQNPDGDVCIRVLNTAVCDQTALNYPPTPQPFDFGRGELTNKSIYEASGKILSQNKYATVYTYETVGVNGLISKAYGANYFVTEYEMKSAKKTKTTEESYTYDATSQSTSPLYTKTETYFSSLYHAMPTKVVVSEASGKVLSEIQKTYVGDVVIPTCTISRATDDATLLSSIANEALTYNFNASPPNTSADHSKFVKWQLYTYYVNLDRINYVNNRKNNNLTYNACMKSTTTWNAASIDLKALIKLKNRNQVSPTIESSRWKDGNFLESEFITYKDFAGDSISIYPYKYEVIKTPVAQIASYFVPVTNTGSSVQKDSKYEQEEIYTYSNSNNPLEILGKNGIITSYLWGYNNELPIAKAEGISYSVLNSAYVAAGSNLTALRAQPSMVNAQLTTYTYDPLIGMTSSMDANNITTYYEYDSLGRLKYIKDKDQNILKTYDYHYKEATTQSAY